MSTFRITLEWVKPDIGTTGCHALIRSRHQTLGAIAARNVSSVAFIKRWMLSFSSIGESERVEGRHIAPFIFAGFPWWNLRKP
ncbi:MAG: hypothetical protein QMB98_01370 [Flaviflexus sp.]|uniref:hypothetical protein n=1 Tax=Flaviflexus sp. TaxID=1969482 RepID=UPI00352FA9DF